MEGMAEKAGESSKTIQRYIWLSRLNKTLLEAVDEGKLSIVSGVDLSFLKEEEQGWVEEIYSMGLSVSTIQAAQLKQSSQKGELNEARVRQIFSVVKNKPGKISIKTEKLRKYFDESVSEEEMEETILKAVANVAESSFLLGSSRNSRGWSISLGWMLKPDHLENILQGKYLDKTPRSDSPLFQPEDGQAPYSNGFYGTVVN